MKGSRTQKVKFGNILLCEYARQELNNKYSLLGVMAGDILVPAFPANIAVGFYIEIAFPSLGKHAAIIRVNYEDTPIAEVHAEVDIHDLSAPSTLIVPNMIIPAGKEGKLKLSGQIDGQNHEILERGVRIGNVQMSASSPAT